MWYYGSAVLVSACWYPALRLVPQLRVAMDALELGRPELIGLLVVAGVATAALFRKRIICASGLKNLVLGALLPFLTMLLFISSMLLYKGMRGGLGGGDVGATLYYGPMFTLMGAYVVVPTGILSQLVMRWAGSRSDRPNEPMQLDRPSVGH